MIQEQTTNDEPGDQSMKEAGPSPDVKNDGDTCPGDDRIEEAPNVSTYLRESGELYAEDVDQHMTVLPDTVMPTAKVAIKDIQVGDPDVPLTEDQERLRQLIWRNKNLLIDKGNALPTAARGAI